MCVWQFECRVCTLLRAGVGVTSTMCWREGKVVVVVMKVGKEEKESRVL